MSRNRKALMSLIFGICVLLVLIFGSTYAYFSVTGTNSFGSKTISAAAEAIGNVALNGTSAQLKLHLQVSDMMKAADDVKYWGTATGAPSITENVVTIGSTQVTGSGYFDCNYTLNVTATGTNNMYTAFQGMTGKSTEQIVLKIGDTKYDFNTSSLFPITINGALNGVTSSDVKSLTAEFYLVNKESVNQDALKGTDITITITATSFSCSVGTPPVYLHDKIVALASNNSCGIQKYTGKVTDRYQDYGVGVDATKVYYPTNNNCNNVAFGGYCWKVIRTTETGGTKLLYNGKFRNGECSTSGDNTNAYYNVATWSVDAASGKTAYVGYMYNPDSVNSTYYDQLRANNVNTADSKVKYYVEYWFARSGIDENKLENAVYCNDRSLATNSPISEESLSASTSGNLYFANYNEKTTLECTYQTDAFSKDNPKAMTNYKTGLMSAPEAMLVGTNVRRSFSNYFLLSPAYFISNGAKIRGVDQNGNMWDTVFVVNSSPGIRPVVSVSSVAAITSGEGSTSSPFIVE